MNGNNPNIFDANNIDQWLNDSMQGSLSLPMSTLANAAFSAMFDQTKRVMGAMVNYKDLMMMYTCAMKEVQTKFEVLSTEFKVRYQRNPISSITTRLKRISSISEKMAKLQKPFTLESIEEIVV